MKIDFSFYLIFSYETPTLSLHYKYIKKYSIIAFYLALFIYSHLFMTLIVGILLLVFSDSYIFPNFLFVFTSIIFGSASTAIAFFISPPPFPRSCGVEKYPTRKGHYFAHWCWKRPFSLSVNGAQTRVLHACI